MKKFVDSVVEITQQAMQVIKDALNKADDKMILLATDKELEDEESLYKLPTASNVSKHGFYVEYGIRAVSLNENDEIIAHCIERGEGGDIAYLKMDESVYAYDIASIADLINK